MDRLETLKSMVDQKPSDTFLRYGLAMEYANSGALEEAVAEFERLLAMNGDYGAAYYHGAQSLEKLGRLDHAREMYRRGIAATARSGDEHTRAELEAALALLG